MELPLRYRPVEAVLFDFQGTLAQIEDPVTRVRQACGSLDDERCAAVALALDEIGWVGSGRLPRVPASLLEAFTARDLSAAAHRTAYTGLAALALTSAKVAEADGLAEAIYERLLTPAAWSAYPDASPVLTALRAAGCKVAVISNVGFDMHAIVKSTGIAELVDEVVLSCDLGIEKPDPEIFRHTCAALGVEPAATLMVGDSPADAGALHAGCRVLGLPSTPAGNVHGLSAVPDLVHASN